MPPKRYKRSKNVNDVTTFFGKLGSRPKKQERRDSTGAKDKRVSGNIYATSGRKVRMYAENIAKMPKGHRPKNVKYTTVFGKSMPGGGTGPYERSLNRAPDERYGEFTERRDTERRLQDERKKQRRVLPRDLQTSRRKKE